MLEKIKNSRRHKMTAICLAVGLVLLSGSVFANYDSASGYSNYKSAAKDLLMRTDNVTINSTIKLDIDGETYEVQKFDYMMDGAKSFSRETVGEEGDYNYVREEYRDGKTEYVYTPERNSYYSYTYSDGTYKHNLLGWEDDSDELNKVVRFAELSADLVVGDLKNNVVLVSNDNGARTYQVNVSKNQMPEIINAGLGLVFGLDTYEPDTTGEVSYTTYDNYWGAVEGYMKSQHPEVTLGENPYTATAEMYGDNFDKYYDAHEKDFETWDGYSNMMEDYFNVELMEKKYDCKGIIHVHDDGSYTYFATEAEYETSTEIPSSDINLFTMFGKDPFISQASLVVTIDDKGHLTYNQLQATLTGVDKNGEKHNAVFTIEMKAKDFGTTVVPAFDPAGKEDENNWFQDTKEIAADEPVEVAEEI